MCKDTIEILLKKIIAILLALFSLVTEYMLYFIIPKDDPVWHSLKKIQLFIVFFLELFIIWEISMLSFLRPKEEKGGIKISTDDPKDKEERFLEKIDEEIAILRLLDRKKEESVGDAENGNLVNLIKEKYVELESIKKNLKII